MISENSPAAASDAHGPAGYRSQHDGTTDALIGFLRERIDEMVDQLDDLLAQL